MKPNTGDTPVPPAERLRPSAHPFRYTGRGSESEPLARRRSPPRRPADDARNAAAYDDSVAGANSSSTVGISGMKPCSSSHWASVSMKLRFASIP